MTKTLEKIVRDNNGSEILLREICGSTAEKRVGVSKILLATYQILSSWLLESYKITELSIALNPYAISSIKDNRSLGEEIFSRLTSVQGILAKNGLWVHFMSKDINLRMTKSVILMMKTCAMNISRDRKYEQIADYCYKIEVIVSVFQKYK